jgi:energy-converting hydrogenase Eha subunit E
VNEGDGWVDLGPLARRQLAEALLSSDAVKALLAAVAEAAGPSLVDGIGYRVELEMPVVRARLVPG